MAAPMDLNVPFCQIDILAEKAKLAQKLGYEVIAINNILPDLLTPPQNKTKKEKKEQQKIQRPDEIKLDSKHLKTALGGTLRKPLRQLSRISTLLNDAAQAHALNTEAVQNYDIVAVTPTSEKTFHQACQSLNVDIITIDVSERLGYRMKRQTVNAALERGIHFELQYSTAIQDPTKRKYFISNAQTINFWCKGKNIILSSGCDKAIQLRGPHDVSNLGILFNMNEAQAKSAVGKNCRAVMYHSESRRMNKSVMSVQKVPNLPAEESWILDKCSVDTDNADQLKTSNNNIDKSHRENSSDEEIGDEGPECKKIKLSNT